MSIDKTNNNSGSGTSITTVGVSTYKFTAVAGTYVYPLPFNLLETSVVEKNDGDLDEGNTKDYTGIGTANLTLIANPNTSDRFRIIQ